eukprot:386988_1
MTFPNKEDELPPLGKTGAFTSACRAYESSKPPNKRQFYDPYAKIFAGANGMKYLHEFCKLSNMNIENATRGIRERTAFLDKQFLKCIDDFLLESNNTDNLIQIVMVGCGGDTRAFRLQLPVKSNIIIYEIDLPSVVNYRDKIFTKNNIFPASNVTIKRIGTDLRYQSWINDLMDKGYDKNKKSIWMLEGILKYFEHGSTLDNIMKWIHSIMKYDSFLIGDVVNNTHIKLTAKPWKDSFGGGKMVSGIDVPETFFKRFGFDDIFYKQVGYKQEDKTLMLNSTLYEGDHIRRWFVFVAKSKNATRSKL